MKPSCKCSRCQYEWAAFSVIDETAERRYAAGVISFLAGFTCLIFAGLHGYEASVIRRDANAEDILAKIRYVKTFDLSEYTMPRRTR